MNTQSQNAIDIILAESLKELAAKKPIEKITIKEITDKAGVIRPTFYNHFQDKYELLEWITVNEIFLPTDPLFGNGMLKEGITFILTAMVRDAEFYKRAVQLEGQNSFNDIFVRCVAQTIKKYIKLEKLEAVGKFPWLTVDVVADFYAHTIGYVVIEWIRGGMQVSTEELTEVAISMFQSSMLEILKKSD